MEKIFQVDAFTSDPFKGNPACVVLLSSPKSDDWMKDLAKEMNLSETAFLLKSGQEYLIRWFTPKVEVDLCGHATLASAYVLFSEGLAEVNETIHFNSASGELRTRLIEGWVELDFPSFQVKQLKLSPDIQKALQLESKQIFQSDVNLLAEMDSFETVRNYRPDFSELGNLPYQGIIITSRMTGDFDFVSRYFAPRAGVAEDPVTGSAHCSLAPYWSRILNKNEFTAYQASERGGVLRVKLKDDRVFIKGQAVTIFKGELQIKG